MKVSELMETKFLCFDADDTLSVAAKKLSERGQREAPVVRQGKLIGILSSADIAAALVKRGIMGDSPADAAKVKNGLAYKHMSPETMHLREDDDILAAFSYLIHRNADSIPVLDRKGKLVGVLLSQEIRKQMAKMLSGGKAPDLRAAAFSASPGSEDSGSGTSIDRILEYVQKRGSASADEVARQFRLPVRDVEGYAESLAKHGLLRVDYNIVGKMKLKKVE